MCSYKLVRAKFEVWGLQTKVEQWTHAVGFRHLWLSGNVNFILQGIRLIYNSLTTVQILFC